MDFSKKKHIPYTTKAFFLHLDIKIDSLADTDVSDSLKSCEEEVEEEEETEGNEIEQTQPQEE